MFCFISNQGKNSMDTFIEIIDESDETLISMEK
jgi:hypothetical protein